MSVSSILSAAFDHQALMSFLWLRALSWMFGVSVENTERLRERSLDDGSVSCEPLIRANAVEANSRFVLFLILRLIRATKPSENTVILAVVPQK